MLQFFVDLVYLGDQGSWYAVFGHSCSCFRQTLLQFGDLGFQVTAHLSLQVFELFLEVVYFGNERRWDIVLGDTRVRFRETLPDLGDFLL